MNFEHSGVGKAVRPFEPEAVRADFPSLQQEVHPGRPLIYFDSAATSLKPASVSRAMAGYLDEYPANVHRGLHVISERATEAFEDAREAVASFLGVEDSAQVIFTRGTTESVNAVAMSWARSTLQPGDAILLNELEHHSNLVPWQMVAKEKGLELRYAELTDDARLEMDAIEAALTDRVKLIAVTAMSNVTATLPPLADIMDLARRKGIRVLIDAAQGLPHGDLDVRRLDPDFLVFSGHKILGPTGVGVLYAKRELLEAMPPFLTGGSMVVRVTRDSAVWNEIPWKFEAGTPPIGEAIALGAALRYLAAFPAEQVAAHERALLEHAHEALGRIPGLRIVGPEDLAKKGPIVSFTMEEAHPHDLAQLLDRHGIAIRAGHHCTMPLHTRLGIPASARASFSLYNTKAEIDLLREALESIQAMFRRRAMKPATPGARQTSPAH